MMLLILILSYLEVDSNSMTEKSETTKKSTEYSESSDSGAHGQSTPLSKSPTLVYSVKCHDNL